MPGLVCNQAIINREKVAFERNFKRALKSKKLVSESSFASFEESEIPDESLTNSN